MAERGDKLPQQPSVQEDEMVKTPPQQSVQEEGGVKTPQQPSVQEDEVVKTPQQPSVQEDEVVNTPQQPSVQEEGGVKTPQQPSVQEDEVVKTPQQPSVQEDEVVKTPQQPSVQEEGGVKTPQQPSVQEDEVVKTPQQPSVQEDEVVKTPHQPSVQEDEVVKTPQQPSVQEEGGVKTQQQPKDRTEERLLEKKEMNDVRHLFKLRKQRKAAEQSRSAGVSKTDGPTTSADRKQETGSRPPEDSGTSVRPSGTSLVVPANVKLLNTCKVVKDGTANHIFIRKARVLIIVNTDFDGKPDDRRDGAEDDYEKLRTIMIEKLGYEDFLREALQDPEKKYFSKLSEDELNEFQDVSHNHIMDYSWTKSQIKSMIKAIAEQPYDGDAIFIFLDSHGGLWKGKEEAVISKDNDYVFVRELIDILNNGKNTKISKFVCIQACRGKKPIPMGTIEIESAQSGNGNSLLFNMDKLSVENVQSLPTPDIGLASGSGDATREQPPLEELEENYIVPVKCPNGFLIMYAAPKGCKSGRQPANVFDQTGVIDAGSYFVQLFCVHLEQCLAKINQRDGMSLLPLLTGVNHAANMYYEECPELKHCLTQIPVLCKNCAS